MLKFQRNQPWKKEGTENVVTARRISVERLFQVCLTLKALRHMEVNADVCDWRIHKVLK